MKYLLFYSFRIVLAVIILPIACFGFVLGALWEFKFRREYFAWFYPVTYLPNNYGDSDKGKWSYPKWMQDTYDNSCFQYSNPISWALKNENFFSVKPVHFSSEY